MTSVYAFSKERNGKKQPLIFTCHAFPSFLYIHLTVKQARNNKICRLTQTTTEGNYHGICYRFRYICFRPTKTDDSTREIDHKPIRTTTNSYSSNVGAGGSDGGNAGAASPALNAGIKEKSCK
jgi:hypothetical protein